MGVGFHPVFAPSALPPELLNALLVVGGAAVDRVVEDARRKSAPKRPGHTLLVGPSGAGKSHVLAVLFHRIREVGDHALVAWTGEEAWAVPTLSEFHRRVCRTLGADYSDLRAFDPCGSDRSGAAEGISEATVHDVIGGRRLWLLIEDFAEVLAHLGGDVQRGLRDWLDRTRHCTVVATHRSGRSDPDFGGTPFEGFFDAVCLEPLDAWQVVDLAVRLGRVRDDGRLAGLVADRGERVLAPAILAVTGGNPRACLVLLESLRGGSLGAFVDAVFAMLDAMLPRYLAVVERMSPQQRRIAGFLVERRHALPVKSIAQHTRMTHQTASSQLKALRDMGQVSATPVGRESYYELADPTMRLGLALPTRHYRHVRFVVESLWLSYAAPGPEFVWCVPGHTEIQRDAPPPHPVPPGKLKRAPEDPAIAAKWHEYEAHEKARDYEQALSVAVELLAAKDDGWHWLMKGHCLSALGRYFEALEAFQEAAARHRQAALAWQAREHDLPGVEQDRAEEPRPVEAPVDNRPVEVPGPVGAEAPADDGASFSPRLIPAPPDLDESEVQPSDGNRATSGRGSSVDEWRIRSVALGRQGRHDESLACSDSILEAVPEDAAALNNRGVALAEIHRDQDSLASLEAAAHHAPSEGLPRYNQAILLARCARLDEALCAVDQAVALGWRSTLTVALRARILLALGRDDEGVEGLEAALSSAADEAEKAEISAGVLQGLLVDSRERPSAFSSVSALAGLHRRLDLLDVLAAALASTAVFARGDASLRTWYDAWERQLGDSSTFRLPLAVLGAAARPKGSREVRTLMLLPAELRGLV